MQLAGLTTMQISRVRKEWWYNTATEPTGSAMSEAELFTAQKQVVSKRSFKICNDLRKENKPVWELQQLPEKTVPYTSPLLLSTKLWQK